MKHSIKVKNRDHLFQLVREHLEMHGDQCDLNHLDVSEVKDLSNIFANTSFNAALFIYSALHLTDLGIHGLNDFTLA